MSKLKKLMSGGECKETYIRYNKSELKEIIFINRKVSTERKEKL